MHEWPRRLHALLTRTSVHSQALALLTELTMPFLRKINVNKNGE